VPETKKDCVFSVEQVAEIEAAITSGDSQLMYVTASVDNVSALCQTVRAAWAANEQATNTLKFAVPNRPFAALAEIAKETLEAVDSLRSQLAQVTAERDEAHKSVAGLSQIIFRSEQATTMRTACVEKVKQMADDWQVTWEKDLTGDHSEKIVYVQAANHIVLALESLTLDQMEQTNGHE
jgi:hypothetical protein